MITFIKKFLSGLTSKKIYSARFSALTPVVEFCLRQINREDMITYITRRYKAAQLLFGSEARDEMVRIYYLLEDFITHHEPIVVKQAFTKTQLREYVKNNFNVSKMPVYERVVFLPSNEKTEVVYQIVLIGFLNYASESLGDVKLRNFFIQHPEFSSFKYDSGSLNVDGEVKPDLYKSLFASLYTLLVQALGERYVDAEVKKLFEWCRSVYDFDVVSIFFELIPDYVLSGERLSVLNRDELERKILERTDELKVAKEKVEEKIKERTKELEAEKFKLSIVTESMNEGAILLDSNYSVIFINATAGRYLNLSKAQLKDFSALTAHVKVAFSTIFPTIDFNQGLHSVTDTPLVFPEVDANKKIFKVSFASVKTSAEDKSVDYYLVWIEDITEAVNLERQKSEFVSIAAHQLRTPLSAMKWALHMIISGDLGALSEDQNVFVKKAYESNDRMILLVNDLLDTDKIVSGRLKYEYSHTNLNGILKPVLDELQNYAKLKEMSLRIDDFENKYPLYIDLEKIRAVLQNLIDNAIKYSKKGGSVSVTAELGDSDTVHINIADTGIGIPEADKANIFTRFFRATNAQKVVADGSGLGLYIAKNIIEVHGGSLSFISEEGKGTTFTVTLPLDIINK